VNTSEENTLQQKWKKSSMTLIGGNLLLSIDKGIFAELIVA
jgi:hypothetical protein